MSQVLEIDRVNSQGEIKSEIDQLVKKLGTFGAWIIGVEDEPERLKKAYVGNDMHFWQADSVEVAKEITDYYVEKGMHPHSYDDSTIGEWIVVY